ncbi:hypothetical protein ACC709_37035, partial [Rhizobium ruizarguesonis]
CCAPGSGGRKSSGGSQHSVNRRFFFKMRTLFQLQHKPTALQSICNRHGARYTHTETKRSETHSGSVNPRQDHSMDEHRR